MSNTTMRLFALMIVVGCSSSDVVPDVLEAHIAVDRHAPDELASIDIVLELAAGNANHEVELWGAALLEKNPDRPGINLKVAFPDGPLVLDPDDERVVSLVNVGTTNADLAPGCSRSFDVLVTIRYLDDPDHGFGDVDLTRVTIDCN